MKPVTVIFALFVCFAISGKAKAQMTGQQMQEKCKELIVDKPAPSFDGGFCAGFISAAIDDESMWRASDKEQKQTHILSFCIPQNGTNGQYLQVFLKYLDEHPEELHKPANFILHEAFSKAFPCGK